MKVGIRMMRMLAVTSCLTLLGAKAQTPFSSGSTGSDGALNLTTSGTVVFDPAALNLNPAGDNVFNFTTINIGPSTTVVMTANLLRNRPVIWLATGNVTISGTLVLKGADGATMTNANPGATRAPSMPGPGGFPGGVGAYLGSVAQPGGGYGGGTAGTNNNSGGDAGYQYNSLQLVPLVGGSGGGGGGLVTNGTAGGNGGAGGGAIRIVSSTSISVTGLINAAGGRGSNGLIAEPGGLGSGGAIHLIAPVVSGSGILDASNGNPSGVIHINATTITYTGSARFNLSTGPLFNPPLPSSGSSVKVVSVNGIAAPPKINASSGAPDFTITAPAPVTVNIAAQNIPPGTVVKLYLSSEQGNDSVVSCPGLTGTLASSTASCAGATFPQGVTVTNIRAVW